MAGDLFGPPGRSAIRLVDKISELKREIKMRKRVYPRWVRDRKLDAFDADFRIKVLQAILRDYQKAAQRGRAPTEEEPSGHEEKAQEGEGEGQRRGGA